MDSITRKTRFQDQYIEQEFENICQQFNAIIETKEKEISELKTKVESLQTQITDIKAKVK